MRSGELIGQLVVTLVHHITANSLDNNYISEPNVLSTGLQNYAAV